MSGENQSELTSKLIDSLYVDAMVLADEARAYFDSAGRHDRLALDPVKRVGFACEALKVTTRLMHIIAWLLARRASPAGETGSGIRPAGDEIRLGDAPETDRDILSSLPEMAVAIIRSSEDLHERIRRFDEGGHADEIKHASPARSLLGRLQRSLG